MRRICALVFAALLGFVWHAPAQASGDFSCTPTWKLAHGHLTGCDNMAMLAAANDTRVNLLLLMADMPGDAGLRTSSRPTPDVLFDWQTLAAHLSPPPDKDDSGGFADGEGSRCRSNDSGTSDFESAVTAATGLAETERAALIAARRDLKPNCAQDGAAPPAITDERIKSATGKAFARYLQGATAFYAGDFDGASAQFAALRTADQSWLRETARYMLGRVEVNRAQQGLFDDYGALKDGVKADAKVIAAAEVALRDYLKAYPRGHYFLSARGLLRRVYWLAGDRSKLAAEYVALLAQPPAARGLDDVALAQEIDAKLLPGLKPENTTDPVLLAVLDLAAMRIADGDTDKDCCGTPLPLAQLEAQRHAFAANPALFDYLLAAHAFYIERKPADVLRLIPASAAHGAFSYLEFSRQMLRGMALEAGGDRDALAFWTQMLPAATLPYQRPALELALALHDERAHALDRVFEAGSPIRTPALREILLTNVADAKLLRHQATAPNVAKRERAVALFTLLYKEATRGPYGDFVTDLALAPPGALGDQTSIYLLGDNDPTPGIFARTDQLGDYDCPPLKATEAQLSRNPHDARARLCLADFMRANGFDDFSLDTQPAADQLGGTTSLFPGPPYSRLEAYKAIIADPKAAAPDKAYALYRAINCYAPSRVNACGGPGVPVSQRKAWFQRLKTGYPTSNWARTLAYYW
jgi:hypothetical protein